MKIPFPKMSSLQRKSFTSTTPEPPPHQRLPLPLEVRWVQRLAELLPLQNTIVTELFHPFTETLESPTGTGNHEGGGGDLGGGDQPGVDPTDFFLWSKLFLTSRLKGPGLPDTPPRTTETQTGHAPLERQGRNLNIHQLQIVTTSIIDLLDRLPSLFYCNTTIAVVGKLWRLISRPFMATADTNSKNSSSSPTDPPKENSDVFPVQLWIRFFRLTFRLCSITSTPWSFPWVEEEARINALMNPLGRHPELHRDSTAESVAVELSHLLRHLRGQALTVWSGTLLDHFATKGSMDFQSGTGPGVDDLLLWLALRPTPSAQLFAEPILVSIHSPNPNTKEEDTIRSAATWARRSGATIIFNDTIRWCATLLPQLLKVVGHYPSPPGPSTAKQASAARKSIPKIWLQILFSSMVDVLLANANDSLTPSIPESTPVENELDPMLEVTGLFGATTNARSPTKDRLLDQPGWDPQKADLDSITRILKGFRVSSGCSWERWTHAAAACCWTLDALEGVHREGGNLSDGARGLISTFLQFLITETFSLLPRIRVMAPSWSPTDWAIAALTLITITTSENLKPSESGRQTKFPSSAFFEALLTRAQGLLPTYSPSELVLLCRLLTIWHPHPGTQGKQNQALSDLNRALRDDIPLRLQRQCIALTMAECIDFLSPPVMAISQAHVPAVLQRADNIVIDAPNWDVVELAWRMMDVNRTRSTSPQLFLSESGSSPSAPSSWLSTRVQEKFIQSSKSIIPFTTPRQLFNIMETLLSLPEKVNGGGLEMSIAQRLVILTGPWTPVIDLVFILVFLATTQTLHYELLRKLQHLLGPQVNSLSSSHCANVLSSLQVLASSSSASGSEQLNSLSLEDPQLMILSPSLLKALQARMVDIASHL